VEAQIAARLVELNRGFYQTLAMPFSATRGRLQPGVQRMLAKIPGEARVLDLGCGNGNLAARLAEGGHKGGYLGLDFSRELLDDAEERVGKLGGQGFAFQVADLTGDWPALIGAGSFESVLAFAVLHHIPSEELRLKLLKQVRGLPAPGGKFIHSNWQFQNSERLRERVQPWSAVGLSEGDVDSGDYLLDWRSGQIGLRYVHQFSEEELAGLAARSGFRLEQTFLSDGESGDLGLYSTWLPA
jgi:SAM-dependent methyltransferase